MTLEELITKTNSIPRMRFEHFDCDKKQGVGYKGTLRIYIHNNKKQIHNGSAYFQSEADSVSELMQNLYEEIPDAG